MPPKFVRRNNASTSSSSASSFSSDEATSSNLNSSSTDESSTSEDSSSSDEDEQNTSPNRKPPQPPRMASANSQQPVTKKVESDSSDDSSSEDEDDKDERACTALIRGVMFRVESKIEEQEEKEAAVANSMVPSQPTATSIVPNNSQPTNNSQVFPLTSTSSQRPPKPPTPPPFVNTGVRTNAAPSPSPLKTQLTDNPTTTTNSVPPIPMNSAAQAAPEDNSYLRDDKEEDDGAVSNLIAKVLSVIAAADTIVVSDPEMPKSQKVVDDTETEESEDETETFIPNKSNETTMPSEKEGMQNQSQEPAAEPPAAVPSPSPQSRMVPSDTETEDSSTESDDSTETEVDSCDDEGQPSRPPASQQHETVANTSAQSAEVAEVTMPANLRPSNSIELPPAPSTNEVATDAGNGTLTVAALTEQPVESTATSSSSQDGDTSVSRSEPIKAEEDEKTEAVVTNNEGTVTPKDKQAVNLQAVNEVITTDQPPLNNLVDEAAASHPTIVDDSSEAASRNDQSNDNADAAKDIRSVVSAMAAAVDELQSNTTTETHMMHDTESTQDHQPPVVGSDENTHVNQAPLPEAVAHGDIILNKDSIDIEAKTFDNQETPQEAEEGPISASQDQTSEISEVGEAAPQTGPVDQSPIEAGNEDQKEASNDEGTPLAENTAPATLNADEDVKLAPQHEAKDNADDESIEPVIKTDSSEAPIERAPEERSANIAPDSAVKEVPNVDTSAAHVNPPSSSHPNDKEIANEVLVSESTPSKIEESMILDNAPLATVAVPSESSPSTANAQDSQEHTKIDQKLTELAQQVVELEPHPNSTTLPQQHAIPSPFRVERGTETAESSPLLNKSVEEKASQTIGFEINAISTQNEASVELRSPLSQPSSAPLSSPTRETPPITAPNRQLGKSALSPPRRAMSSPSRQPPSDTASKLKQIAAIRNARSPSKEPSAADPGPIEPTESNQNPASAAPDAKAHRSLKPLPAISSLLSIWSDEL